MPYASTFRIVGKAIARVINFHLWKLWGLAKIESI
jgi:hypothetical protein